MKFIIGKSFAALGIALSLFAISLPASAEPASAESGSGSTAGAGASPNWNGPSECPAASSYLGHGADYLSNGTLNVYVCIYPSNAIAYVNTQYIKTGGSTIHVHFGWEFVTATGGDPGGGQMDSNSYYLSSGSNQTIIFDYSSVGGKTAPDPIQHCVRGKLAVSGQGTYSTSVVCY